MSKKQQKPPKRAHTEQAPRCHTPTFLLELPLQVDAGQAKRVRFKSRGRGLSSIENKRHDTGLRFVLQKPEEGNQGTLIWKDDRLAARIDWNDPVVSYGLAHRIKYVRLLQRKASSPQAQGADAEGFRYFAQLALQGVPQLREDQTQKGQQRTQAGCPPQESARQKGA